MHAFYIHQQFEPHWHQYFALYRFDATEFNTILAENGLVGIPTPDDLPNRFKLFCGKNKFRSVCSGDIF